MNTTHAVLLAGFILAGSTSVVVAQVQSTPQLTPSENVTTTTIAGNEPAAATPTPTPAAANAAAIQSAVAAAAGIEQAAERTIRKEIGQSEFISGAGVSSINVSNPNVIIATVTSDRGGVSVNTLAQGTSDLDIFYQDNSRRRIRFVVTSVDVEKDLQDLRALLSDVVGVSATRIGDRLVTQGKIVSISDYRRYQTIIKEFAVVDLVEIEISETEQRRFLGELRNDLDQRELRDVDVALRRGQEGQISIWLTGTAQSEQDRAEAAQIASLYFPGVINHVNLNRPMVEMDIVMITVDMDKAARRGDNIWNKINTIDFTMGTVDRVVDDLGNTTNVFTPKQADWGTGGAGDLDEELLIQFGPESFTATLEASKDQSYVVAYAAPQASVVSGETAIFKDGSRLFVQLVGNEAVGIAEIETGLTFQATPTVLPTGKIRVDINSEIRRSRGASAAEEFGENSVIAVKDFSTTSTVEVFDGQTIVVSSSNSNLFGTTQNEFPLLSKIPIINFFFKSSERAGSNVRSFFFVTPTSPNVYREQGRIAHSAEAERARVYYEKDAQFRKGTLGYYLGWEKDIPAPPPLATNPEVNEPVSVTRD